MDTPAMAVVRSRNDPRREVTRKALLAAAEALFSRNGVRAVTVRQIAAAVQSSNNNIVSYHFGSKDALIDAVFIERFSQLDRRSAELLANDGETEAGPERLRFLVNALWRPLFEAVDAEGRRSYARFMRAVMVEDLGHRIRQIAYLNAQTRYVTDEIKALVPAASARHFQWRLASVTYMVLDAICLAEEPTLAQSEDGDGLFEKTLDMAIGALLA